MWHTPMPDSHPAAQLLSASAVRERCAAIMAAAERGQTRHLGVQEERLAATAAYVSPTPSALRYPTLDVPYHSRWRHFEAGGHRSLRRHRPRTFRAMPRGGRAHGSISRSRACFSTPARARRGVITMSDRAARFARSEGLAVASLRLFAAGAFSARADAPFAADAEALAALETSTHGEGLPGERRQSARRDRWPRGVAARDSARWRALRRWSSARQRGSAICYDYFIAHAEGLDQRRIPGRDVAARARTRSGRRASRSMACRSAIPGGILRRAPRIPPIPPPAMSLSTSSRSARLLAPGAARGAGVVVAGRRRAHRIARVPERRPHARSQACSEPVDADFLRRTRRVDDRGSSSGAR